MVVGRESRWVAQCPVWHVGVKVGINGWMDGWREGQSVCFEYDFFGKQTKNFIANRLNLPNKWA